MFWGAFLVLFVFINIIVLYFYFILFYQHFIVDFYSIHLFHIVSLFLNFELHLICLKDAIKNV